MAVQVREDPLLEPDEQTYAATINCFREYVTGSPIASLSSTLVGAESFVSGMTAASWTPALPVDDDALRQSEQVSITDEDVIGGENV